MESDQDIESDNKRSSLGVVARCSGFFRSVAAGAGRIARSPGFWGIALLIVIAWLIGERTDYMERSRSWLANYGLLTLVPLAFAHAVVSVSPFPGELVAFHNSLILGFALGAFCNWCGWMLGAAMQYSLARRTASDIGIADLRESDRLPNWMRRLPMDRPVFLIAGRWLPFGAHLVNTTAGVLKVPIGRHLACSALGIIPHALLVAGLAQGWDLIRGYW